MKRLLNNCVLFGVMLIATGCFSTSTLHTARPLPKGQTVASVSPQVMGMVFNDPLQTVENGTVTEENKSIALPNIEAQFRHGVGEHLDIGLKLFLPGVGMDFNILLVDKPKFAMSIDPAFTAMYLSVNNANLFISTLWLPVLFDVLTTDVVTITLGAKPGLIIVGASATADSTTEDDNVAWSDHTADGFMGGMGGIKFQLTDNFYLMPEFNGIWEFKAEVFWWTGIISFGFKI